MPETPASLPVSIQFPLNFSRFLLVFFAFISHRQEYTSAVTAQGLETEDDEPAAFSVFSGRAAQIMGSAADGDLLHDRHPVHGGSWQDLWYPAFHHLLKGQAGLFLHCLVTVFQLELAHICGLLKRKDLK